MSNMTIATAGDQKRPAEKASDEKRQSISVPPTNDNTETSTKSSKLAGFRKSLGIKSSEEKAVAKTKEQIAEGHDQWRQIVAVYQEKVGMTRKIAHLRARQPIRYLHLLRAGYFELIPVAWAGAASNSLKFSIESAAGWRGITPMWRGYEDTAEERLYWVLNHREGSVGMRMEPDFISAMVMARARMASAHTSPGYSKQVMSAPFRAYDRPAVPTDDTMVLLDVSGSMDFDPVCPNYNKDFITGYSRSTQPKNKGDPNLGRFYLRYCTDRVPDVAKAIIRR
ncbi:hypothetical protein V1527DRAFT_516315 [Lipomyces starkeyi]